MGSVQYKYITLCLKRLFWNTSMLIYAGHYFFSFFSFYKKTYEAVDKLILRIFLVKTCETCYDFFLIYFFNGLYFDLFITEDG